MNASPAELMGHWSAIQSQRLRWAAQAYEAFLGTLSTDIRGRLDRDPIPRVIVFGPTQRGKTTLILALLGVEPRHRAEVERALRGGRRSGSSATPTAFRYTVSPDDRWTLADGDRVCEGLSSTEVRGQVAAIRDRFINQRERSPNPISVGIPSSFVNSRDAMKIEVFDLPGVRAQDLGERRYALDMAARHLPHADAILLHALADDLGSFRPENTEVPGLEAVDQWWENPQRFRLVITHAVSLASTRAHVESLGRPITLGELRCLCEADIRTHARHYPRGVDWDLVTEMIYPIDLGESWEEAPKRIKELTRDALEASLKTLRESLDDHLSPTARIAQAFTVYRMVESGFVARERESSVTRNKIVEGLKEVQLERA